MPKTKKPVPNIGDCIAIWWAGDQRYFICTVVDKTLDSIRVSYIDGEWATEDTEKLNYIRGATVKDWRQEFTDRENNVQYIRSAGGIIEKKSLPLVSAKSTSATATSTAITMPALKSPKSSNAMSSSAAKSTSISTATSTAMPSSAAKSTSISPAATSTAMPSSAAKSTSISTVTTAMLASAAKSTSAGTVTSTAAMPVSVPKFSGIAELGDMLGRNLSKYRSHSSGSEKSNSPTMEDLLNSAGIDPASLSSSNSSSKKSTSSGSSAAATAKVDKNEQATISQATNKGNDQHKRLKTDTSSSSAANDIDDIDAINKQLAAYQDQEAKLKLGMAQLELQRQSKLSTFASVVEESYGETTVAIKEFIAASQKLKSAANQLKTNTTKFKTAANVESIKALMETKPMLFSPTFAQTRANQEASHQLLVVEDDLLSDVLNLTCTTPKPQ